MELKRCWRARCVTLLLLGSVGAWDPLYSSAEPNSSAAPSGVDSQTIESRITLASNSEPTTSESASSSELPPPTLTPTQSRQPHWRGWDYIASKLKRDGVTEERLRQVFRAPELPAFAPISFSLQPRESAQIYEHFVTPPRLAVARSFTQAHRVTFDRVQRTLGVNRKVIAAILLVETQFGKNAGNHLVLNRLLRVASVRDPENLDWNHMRLQRDDRSVTREQVEARAIYLESTFYPEVLALLEIARRERLNPFRIKGSYAGAWGIPQFLPTSYLKFGRDGDGNGHVSLFSVPDAIWSTANYLVAHGWKDSLKHEEKRQVIWHYNRSEPYVSTVLALEDSI